MVLSGSDFKALRLPGGLDVYRLACAKDDAMRR
jgi:hypothetical protein